MEAKLGGATGVRPRPAALAGPHAWAYDCPIRYRECLRSMSRFLIVVGLGWHWLARIPFGRLPGDIHIVHDGFNFHFPIITCIVISVVVSALLWFCSCGVESGARWSTQ
ncbi:hypothetical protein OKW41_004611 [Paraburkholderia sp. UCT70]|uniref:DUF2905 domain-containing protein n=1 Tax=Paraburkholderia sp. UCT70 TaxID=2991068 RepID=UPI003D1E25F9